MYIYIIFKHTHAEMRVLMCIFVSPSIILTRQFSMHFTTPYRIQT